MSLYFVPVQKQNKLEEVLAVCRVEDLCDRTNYGHHCCVHHQSDNPVSVNMTRYKCTRDQPVYKVILTQELYSYLLYTLLPIVSIRPCHKEMHQVLRARRRVAL